MKIETVIAYLDVIIQRDPHNARRYIEAAAKEIRTRKAMELRGLPRIVK